MRYQIHISAGAAREIRKLPKDVAELILEMIDDLADDPRPSGAKKLQGIPDGYRVRKGVYRIVYTIEDDILRVGIVTAGHRKEVYKRVQGRITRRVH